MHDQDLSYVFEALWAAHEERTEDLMDALDAIPSDALAEIANALSSVENAADKTLSIRAQVGSIIEEL